MIWVMVEKPKNNKQRELLHQTREGQGHKSLLTHLTCSWASQVVSEERSPNLGTEHSGAVGFSPISGSREGQATHQGTPGTKKKATLSSPVPKHPHKILSRNMGEGQLTVLCACCALSHRPACDTPSFGSSVSHTGLEPTACLSTSLSGLQYPYGKNRHNITDHSMFMEGPK